jgi:hypothetical protein
MSLEKVEQLLDINVKELNGPEVGMRPMHPAVLLCSETKDRLSNVIKAVT